jgi:hypothetical protein
MYNKSQFLFYTKIISYYQIKRQNLTGEHLNYLK